MNQWLAVGVLVLTGLAPAQVAAPPKAGKVDIFRLKDIKPGLQATAWTVFKGMEAEAVPVEIIGVWKNAIGPNQDVILGKMGGKAKETNVAGGMSGSPVYIDGKLVGAVALRLSVFSPDAICGITPIERMLEINDIDKSRPPDARTPVETPLVFSGFNQRTIESFDPLFSQMGIVPVQGGAGAAGLNAKPASGWEHS